MTCIVERSLLCLEDADVVAQLTSTDWPVDVDDDVIVDDDVDDDVAAGSGRSSCRRALHCGTLVTDDRVLSNLLVTERHRRPSADCFCQQTEVLPYMRDTVVTWMLEVIPDMSLCLSINVVCIMQHVRSRPL